MLETNAMGKKNSRLIPPAADCSMFLKTLKYIMRINPPPSPIEAVSPAKNPAK